MTDKKDTKDTKDNKDIRDKTPIEVLTNQLAEMQAKLDQLERQQNEPERVGRDGVAVVSQDDIRAFLAEEPQETSFWSEDPAPVVCLRGDEKTYDADLRREKVSPCFWAPFTRWFGVGAELRRDNGTLVYPRGIGRYVLATTDPDGPLLLKRMVARASSEQVPRIYTDEEWKIRMKAEYESRGAAQAVRDKYKRRMAQLEAGAAEGDPKLGA